MFAIPPAPIHFREIFKTKVWGARRLETLLGKSLPPGEPVGESWEISDHPHGLSRVDAGVLAGMSLHDLVPPMRDEIALVGRPGALELGNRFPLLFKFIDTADFLSVQVHPADDYARKNEQGDPGKIEAWVVVHAEPGARIALGLKPGTTRREFSRAVETGDVEQHLRFVPVRRRDVFVVPPGTVHAVGPGVLLAEIQQNSDATYRLYDWGRMGLDGKPRDLHVEKALDVIDFAASAAPASVPELLPDGPARHERLVANAKFTLDRYACDAPFELRPADLRSFVILACIAGRAELACSDGTSPMSPGRTLLLPASLRTLTVRPAGPVELLAMSLPIPGGSQ
jgi:mannose-6-phosphate isomerase